MTSPEILKPLSSARRMLVAAGATVLGSVVLSGPARAQAKSSKPHKLVMQVSDNDPGKWGLALNNANNVQTNLGADHVDIEIVVYGPGVNMLKADSPVGARIAGAVKSGVKVVACETTLAAMKLSHADLLPTVGYVPGGVVELMQKQQQGYAYVRP
jgi:intracellular sulfur oxidation DsrE/DsrF family protein